MSADRAPVLYQLDLRPPRLVVLECSRAQCARQTRREIPDDDGQELYCGCGGRLTGALTREPDPPLAALVSSFTAAYELARGEYHHRETDDGRWIACSRGSDGGMHYRRQFARESEALAYCQQQAREFAARIITGELDGLLVFRDEHRGTAYIA